MKFTKAQLMETILRQQESINFQHAILELLQEKICLLEKQNKLLWDYNDKLTRDPDN